MLRSFFRVIFNTIIDKGIVMINLAITFLVLAIIAALLGFSGIAGTATQIAWILFVVGLVLSIIFYVIGRRPPPI